MQITKYNRGSSAQKNLHRSHSQQSYMSWLIGLCVGSGVARGEMDQKRLVFWTSKMQTGRFEIIKITMFLGKVKHDMHMNSQISECNFTISPNRNILLRCRPIVAFVRVVCATVQKTLPRRSDRTARCFRLACPTQWPIALAAPLVTCL